MDKEWKAPIELSISLLSRKWGLEILLQLMDGRQRFSDLQESISGVSAKMLFERLKEFHREGIVEKIIFNVIPLKVKYQLTERGNMLRGILFELSMLGMRLFPEDGISSSLDNKEAIISQYAEYFNVKREVVNFHKGKFQSDDY